MGWYQWQLFIVVGFGWANDNLWPIVTSLICTIDFLPSPCPQLTTIPVTPITNEFNPSRPSLLSLAQNIGLLAGALFWGFGCDIFGRRWGFNFTLGITAVFGLVAAGSPTFAAIGCFAALWSFGVGKLILFHNSDVRGGFTPQIGGKLLDDALVFNSASPGYADSEGLKAEICQSIRQSSLSSFPALISIF